MRSTLQEVRKENVTSKSSYRKSFVFSRGRINKCVIYVTIREDKNVDIFIIVFIFSYCNIRYVVYLLVK